MSSRPCDAATDEIDTEGGGSTQIHRFPVVETSIPPAQGNDVEIVGFALPAPEPATAGFGVEATNPNGAATTSVTPVGQPPLIRDQVSPSRELH
jgi:hypothetical protein